MPFLNQDLKFSALPNIERIKQYVYKANITNDFSIRDTRPLMSLLQKLTEIDGHLLGLVTTRKLAAKSYNYTIRLSPEYKLSPAEEIRLNETKTRFRRSGIFNLIDDILDGVLYGLFAVRLVWTNTNFGTMVTRKETYDITDLDINTQNEVVFLQTSAKNPNSIVGKEILDPDTHLLLYFNPNKNRKYFIGSYMRTCMLLSYLKYNTRWDWRDLNVRHGNPATYATHPQGISEDEIQKLLDALAKLKSDAYATFPDYVKILYDEALKSDNTNSFADFVKACNTELSIALHGQNLTTEVQSGSRAAAQVHNSIDDLIIEADLRVIAEVFSNQYLKMDYLLNYGEPLNDFFEFVFLPDEQIDYESNSRIITNIASDPEMRKLLPLKKAEVYQKLGFTKPAEGDEVL
jgi:phage gp29-like protein